MHQGTQYMWEESESQFSSGSVSGSLCQRHRRHQRSSSSPVAHELIKCAGAPTTMVTRVPTQHLNNKCQRSPPRPALPAQSPKVTVGRETCRTRGCAGAPTTMVAGVPTHHSNELIEMRLNTSTPLNAKIATANDIRTQSTNDFKTLYRRRPKTAGLSSSLSSLSQ